MCADPRWCVLDNVHLRGHRRDSVLCLALQVFVSPAWWVTRPFCPLFIETQGWSCLGSKAYQQLPWLQSLGPAQHTEFPPASKVWGEVQISAPLKSFSRICGGFSRHFPGLLPNMVQTPGWEIRWEGTWHLSCMAAPLAPLPPKGEGNGQGALPRPVGVDAATQESSTDTTRPG